MSKGVTVTFFCDAIHSLGRLYPDRACGEQMEAFRAALAEAENLYRQMPVMENKSWKASSPESVPVGKSPLKPKE